MDRDGNLIDGSEKGRCPCCGKHTKVFTIAYGPRVYWIGCIPCAQGVIDLLKMLEKRIADLKAKK